MITHVLAVLMLAAPLAGQTLQVEAVSPPAAILTAPTASSISITFDRAIDPATVTPRSFHAFSRGAGALLGSFSFSSDGRTVTLDPVRNASSGEPVTVTIANTIRGLDNTPMRSAGYQWRYWTQARPATMNFKLAQEITTQAFPGENVVPYGGSATDLDGDGWIDLSIVNEGTNDVRVFMNSADGSCAVDSFLQPGNTVGNTPSPSEPQDFNFDGLADVCTANLQGDSISILLGNGDGTYQPAQTTSAGNQPRGITTLDVDGDGDLDIVNTNASTGNAMIWLNDGNGSFPNPIAFQPGISGEWSIQADDLNGDGIFDIVIGGSSQVRVMLGTGNATFTTHSTVSAPARCWQMNLGDADGDGDVDVFVVCTFTDEAVLYKNTGNGALASGVTYPTDSFPLATDVGDLDGDGDLDWITSSYNGDWFIFTNNGNGTFVFHSEIDAPIAASCSLPVDMDNDGDLDLVFIDELGDWLFVFSNGGNNGPPTDPADLNGDGTVDGADLGLLLAGWNTAGPGDINGDGLVDGADLGLLLIGFSG
jgi:hypothetical protein